MNSEFDDLSKAIGYASGASKQSEQTLTLLKTVYPKLVETEKQRLKLQSLIDTIKANSGNINLTDAEFRQFIRNSLEV